MTIKFPVSIIEANYFGINQNEIACFDDDRVFTIVTMSLILIKKKKKKKKRPECRQKEKGVLGAEREKSISLYLFFFFFWGGNRTWYSSGLRT
jgi:hypothetical protein